MEFKIGKNQNGFFIKIEGYLYESLDKNVANYLDLSLLEYLEILKKYGAKQKINEYFFQSSDQVEGALKALEHYIIMAKIIE